MFPPSDGRCASRYVWRYRLLSLQDESVPQGRVGPVGTFAVGVRRSEDPVLVAGVRRVLAPLLEQMRKIGQHRKTLSRRLRLQVALELPDQATPEIEPETCEVE